MHRLYEYGDIAVFWDSEKCRHAKRCVTGSPKTFDFQRRPWIDLTQAPTMEIWQTIDKCPTKALTCVYTHEVIVELDMDNCRSVAYMAAGSASKGNDASKPTEGSDDSSGIDNREKIGECDFRRSGNEWIIYHTEVSPEYGGKGIAKRLVYKLLEAAEREGATVNPLCSYAAKVLSGE